MCPKILDHYSLPLDLGQQSFADVGGAVNGNRYDPTLFFHHVVTAANSLDTPTIRFLTKSGNPLPDKSGVELTQPPDDFVSIHDVKLNQF